MTGRGGSNWRNHEASEPRPAHLRSHRAAEPPDARDDEYDRFLEIISGQEDSPGDAERWEDVRHHQHHHDDGSWQDAERWDERGRAERWDERGQAEQWDEQGSWQEYDEPDDGDFADEPEQRPSGEVSGRHRKPHEGGQRLLIELRIVKAVLQRELTKYWRGKARIASGFAQPLLFLLIFGFGIQSMMPERGGVNFAAYVFPGVLAMNVLGRSFASAIAVVYDGEQGFLREMLVAPASRVSIVVGAILGGAVTAMIQAALLFVAAPIMGVIPGPLSILYALGLVLLMATLITALGVAGATFIKSVQTYQAISQTVMYPMLVLSGALFPLNGLPEWIQVIGKLNPVTYSIDAMRRVLLEVDGPDSPFFDLTGVTVLGHLLSVPDEIGITVGITLILVAVGARGFGRVK